MALVHPQTHQTPTTTSPSPYALPVSFPSSIASPLAWTGADLADESYIYYLTSSDLSEIKSALVVFKCTFPHFTYPPFRPNKAAGRPASLPNSRTQWGGGLHRHQHIRTYIHMHIHREIADTNTPSAHGLNGDLATPTTFPLPTLGPKLRALSSELCSGRGVCLIRGLEKGMYEGEEGMVVFMGLQSYVAGMKGRQDERGNMIGKSLV